MRAGLKIFIKALLFIFVILFISVLLNNSFDIYNDFAYDKAIIRESPYGYTPMLKNVHDYSSSTKNLKSGDFVYVEDWLSAHNGRIAFAKVRSKFEWGYVNNKLLVETNINVVPIISGLMLISILILILKNFYRRLIFKNVSC